MTEALFSINNAGQLTSALYYTITAETLECEIISDELLLEVLHRANDPNSKDWNFTFDDLQVEIIKKLEYKIEFFVSRDVSIGESGQQLPFDN